MKNKNYVQLVKRKRKMLFMLPLLTIPFLTMAFWSMKDGGTKNLNGSAAASRGLNTALPQPRMTAGKNENKLSFYEQAERDSLKLVEQMKLDPYFKIHGDDLTGVPSENGGRNATANPTAGLNTSLTSSSPEKPEQKLMEKIEQLNNLIDKPQSVDWKKETYPGETQEAPGKNSLQNPKDISAPFDHSSQVTDPEIEQLNTTLDKILDIQHPERVKEKLKKAADQDRGRQNKNAVPKTTMEGEDAPNGFFELVADKNEPSTSPQIEVVVDQRQQISSGQTIRLKTTEPIRLGEVVIAKNTLVFGITSRSADRVLVHIQNIRVDKRLVPAEFSAYDMDGIEGIHIPGSSSPEGAKQTLDNTIQTVELSALDPGLKMQAAATGINAAKNLLSKKTKRIRFTVPAGYLLYLKNKND